MDLAEELQMIARTLPDNISKETCEVINKAAHTIKNLQESLDWYRERVVWGHYEDIVPHYVQGKPGEHEINEPVTADQVRNMYKALETYKRERDRFRHAHPEMTGEFFLTGGHGGIDSNLLPKFVTICPAYGCAWEQVYEKTDRTVSYEGS
jgi:cephalosporin hydroxylase